MQLGRTRAWWLLAAASFVASTPAAGEETATSLARPSLTLSVTPGTGGAQWKLRIENTGELPVRIAADQRLLVLEITAPNSDPEKPVRCALPDDTRPSTDEGRELVVPAKR